MKKYIINGKEIELLDGLIGDNGRIIYPAGSDDTSNKINEIIQALGTPVPEPKKEFKRWRAEIGGKFYVVHPNCVGKTIHYTDDNNDVDNVIYNSGNYHQTLELAEKALDKQLALTKLNDIIMEKNEGWVADWSDFEQEKYTIGFDYKIKVFWTGLYRYINYNPLILFIKSEKIAEEIIKNHKDLLDTIWGVESK